MFGGQQDTTNLSVNGDMGGALPTDTTINPAPTPLTSDPAAPAAGSDSPQQTPGYDATPAPMDAGSSFGVASEPATPAASSDTTTPPVTPVAAAAPAPAPAAPVADVDALIDIKQQALQQLSPLVGHLDQQPEEKFRTTMMMIQASDDSSLINDAYQAAQQISDDKVKAQALLDIVNEINYFTQQHDNQ